MWAWYAESAERRGGREEEGVPNEKEAFVAALDLSRTVSNRPSLVCYSERSRLSVQ